MSYKHLTQKLILLSIASISFGISVTTLMFMISISDKYKPLDGANLTVALFLIFMIILCMLLSATGIFKLVMYIKAYVYEKYETKLG